MAWTEYTAPLAPGDELTAAMIAEVLAALDERLKAVDAAWGVESAGAEEIALRASGLPTHRVYYTGPATSGGGTVTNGLGELSAVVAKLSESYQRPKFIEAGTGTSGAYSGTAVLTEALTDLGESGTAASWTAATVDSRVFWNMVRAALQLCRWVGLAGSSTATTTRVSPGPFPRSFADAKTSWSGSSPIPAGSGFEAGASAMRYDYTAPPANDYRVDSFRATASVAVPTGAMWSAGWGLAARLTCSRTFPGYIGQDLSPAAFVMDLGGVEQDHTPTTEATIWIMGPAGITATGSQALGLRSEVEDDVDVFDSIMAAATTDTGFTGGGFPARIAASFLKPATGTWLAGKPGFTYP